MSESLDKKTYALFETAANKKIIGELEMSGSKTFRFPPLETVKISPDEGEKEIFSRIRDFDWIIFTDVFSVEFFLQTLEECDVDIFELDDVKVCALGEVVSDALRFVQLHADIIADTTENDKIFTAIKEYLYAEQLRDLRFLLVKEISQTFEFAEQLKSNGAEVFNLSVYEAKIAEKREIVKLKTLLRAGAVDEFVFSSPADFTALRFYFAGESIADLLSEIQISAVSEAVFQTAKEFNLRPLYFHL